MIDIHTHILPSIDDGANNIEESIEIIKKASLNGVTDIILTPHFIMGSYYNANNQDKKKLITKLKRLIKKENIPINIYIGNEVYVENNMLELKKDGYIATLNNSKYLLFELPFTDSYNGLEDILFDLNCKKITGIIAHPERYSSVKNNPSIIYDWIERGALLQCNIGSFFGKYGKRAKKTAILLLKHRAISFIASDIHRETSVTYDKINKLKKMMRKYITEDEINDLFVNNAKKIIEKDIIDKPKVKPFKKGLFGKWK